MEPLHSFVDEDDVCMYNPIIIPFLTQEEKELLDNGDMVFYEEEGVEEKVEEKNSNEEKSSRTRSDSVTINIGTDANLTMHVRSSE